MEIELTFKNRAEFRLWLEHNHQNDITLWLKFAKKDSGIESVHYDEAVEEALCFGWIDSLVKKIDNDYYKQKFTRRKPNSVWSELNKLRVEKLIENGRMTSAGLKSIDKAKSKGRWSDKDREKDYNLPVELKSLLDTNIEARMKYESLTTRHRNEYHDYINEAKKPETRVRRSERTIKMLLTK